MRALAGLAVVLVSAACSSPTATPGGLTLRHAARSAPDLRSTEVRVTFSGGRPDGLRLGRRGGAAAIADLRALPGDRPLSIENGHIVLPPGEPIDAVSYRVLHDRVPSGRPAPVVYGDDAVALEADLLLLRGTGAASEAGVTLSFTESNELDTATPFAMRSTSGALIVPPSAFSSVCYVAIGKREVQRFRRDGVTIEVARLGPVALSDDDIERWIGDAVEQTVAAFGRLRSTHLLVVLSPSPGGGEPRFGVAYHGGGPALFLFLGEDTSATDVATDWIGQHETAHTGVPRFRAQDAWFSEGLATYYQAVLRARSGHLSEQEAWAELIDGFTRGASRAGDTTLRDDSAHMAERHAFWRVYWSGAALALRWDVVLRRDHGRTLDDALASLWEHPSAGAGLSADQALAALDAWLGEPLFSESANRHLDGTGFPDVSEPLEFLGAHETRLEAAAPGADVRRAITAPR